MKLNIFAAPDPAKLADKQLREARLHLMETEAALEQHTAARAALLERIKRLEAYTVLPSDATRRDIEAVRDALTKAAPGELVAVPDSVSPAVVRELAADVRPVIPHPQSSPVAPSRKRRNIG